MNAEGSQRWEQTEISDTLNIYNNTELYTPILILSYRSEKRNQLIYTETIGALCATDYKWVQQEQVVQGKLIVEVK